MELMQTNQLPHRYRKAPIFAIPHGFIRFAIRMPELAPILIP
jgi:hypothetical protein